MRIPNTTRHNVIALAFVLAGGAFIHKSFAATKTWDGGGSPNFNWSIGANWDSDTAPNATGDSLVFAGSTGLLNTNDSAVTSLGSTSITFAAGAESFVLSGASQITVGNGLANDNFVTQASANAQTIALPIKLVGGGRDRTIIMSGSGSLTLSGNIDLSNDWLFPATTAGTIILSGNNSGDGKGGVLTAGSNSMRAAMRNNVANTVLVLGSSTALGNHNASYSDRRGLWAEQVMYLKANTDLTGANAVNSTFVINNAWIDCNGANDLEIGGLINRGGNRDFKVTGSGSVIISGQGIDLSEGQTGRQLYLNLSGSGTLTIDGQIHDTFHSGGVSTTVNGGDGNPTKSILRVANGTAYINGDNGTTFTGDFRIHNGAKVVLGHDNALGTTGTGSQTDIDSGGTLDLNGHSIVETFYGLDGSGVGGQGAIINDNTSTVAALASNIGNFGTITIGGAGDINTLRLIGPGFRTITKVGGGTLTVAGDNHNNNVGWNVQAGTVVLANTTGRGADYHTTINGGTLRLSGANTDIINDTRDFTVNTGTFDLNGKTETIKALGGSGGVVENGILTVGANDGSASYAGLLQDGTGNLSLTKIGSGSQTLAGANNFTGNTAINSGTLALSGNGSLASPNISVATGAAFDVSGVSGGSHALNGSGTLTLNINKSGGTSQGQIVIGAKNLACDGALTVTATGDALASGDSFTLISKTSGALSGWFSSVILPALDPGLSWDTNNLATTGVLDVYNFSTTPLTLSTLANKPATNSAAKLATHVSSSKLVPAYPAAGWTASATGATLGTALFSNGDLIYTPGGAPGTDYLTVTFQDGHGSQTMAVTVNVNSANAGPSLTVSDNGSGYGTFTASGLPDATYMVQISGDLSTWTDHEAVQAAGNGVIIYTDSVSLAAQMTALGSSSVYYRLREQ